METSKRKKKIIVWIIVGVTLIIIVGGGAWYFWYSARYPSTDDAYTDAHVVHVAPQINGMIAQVPVINHQHVLKDELMFEIDPAPFRIALQHAEAQLSQTNEAMAAANNAVEAAQARVNQSQATLDETIINARRTKTLVKQKLLPQSDEDAMVAQLQTARAQLAASKADLQQAINNRGQLGKSNPRIQAALAQVSQAQLNLSYTQVRAPADGVIAGLHLRPGNTVSTGQELFAVVEGGKWWVDANYKETDLNRIKPGQPATISIDMYPGTTFKGVVDSISPASGTSFSLLPPENATGNWVKVTQRFPVKVVITPMKKQFPLRIGASCKVTIDTTKNTLPQNQTTALTASGHE
jgi:membrane fusion protein (multidrug efflux system)